MSYKQYRTLDLCVWCVMYAVFEYLCVMAATVWFDEPYSVSLMLPLLLIVMMRWDIYALVQAVFSAVVFVLFMKGSVSQMLVYAAGNLGLMLDIFFLKKTGKEKVRKSFLLSEAYAVIGFVLMEVFRGLASMVILKSPLGTVKEFVLTDMLVLVFTFVIIFIVRQINDLFMDQKTYLIQLNKNKNDDFSSNETEEQDDER